MIFEQLQGNDYAVTTTRGGCFRFGFFSFSKTSIAGGAGV